MRLRLIVALLLVGLTLTQSAWARPKSPGPGADDFKGRMQKVLAAWETLDSAKAAPFYAKDADLKFFDLAPLKYTGWAEYAAGVDKVAADLKSIRFTLGDDARTYRRGNVAWATATMRAEVATKGGAKQTIEGRWTLVWEKRGKDWLIVHEHFSAPLPSMETTGPPHL